MLNCEPLGLNEIEDQDRQFIDNGIRSLACWHEARLPGVEQDMECECLSV